jgi:hypothetical protein
MRRGCARPFDSRNPHRLAQGGPLRLVDWLSPRPFDSQCHELAQGRPFNSPTGERSEAASPNQSMMRSMSRPARDVNHPCSRNDGEALPIPGGAS